MTQTSFHLTQEGLDELTAELTELKSDKLPSLIERVKVAREQGDLSENSEYHAARDELAFVEGRIEELEELISRAQLVKRSSGGDTVSIGYKENVKSNGSEHTYHVVGKYEADPMNKKISDESPLGKALLGRKIGEEVQYEAPVGKIIYEVLKIH
jgi:transcription elongation factor GreA